MKNKGITLIALVITIIVLLILAGVTIVALGGENGIIRRALSAREITNLDIEREQRSLSAAEAAMNFEQTTYTDEKGKKVPIPAGFAVSQVKGENTVENGLVIIDSQGNEFVWIPVENPSEYEEANKLSTGWSRYAYDTDGGSSNSLKAKTWANDPTQMATAIASVNKNKGFYIARYEAGVPSNADFYVPSNESGNGKTYTETNYADLRKTRNVVINKSGQELKPVSKKGNQAWNFIHQTNSVTLSKNMYKGSASVNSYLVDSNAWNYICKYIFEGRVSSLLKSSDYGNYYNNTKTNYEGIVGLFAKHSNTSSDGWISAKTYDYGNVTSNFAPKGEGDNRLELATGSCDDFKVYNIYDMAGNMWEWTAEEATALDNSNIMGKYAVRRGGGFSSSDSFHPVVISLGDGLSSGVEEVMIGFRVVLYLK